MNLFTGIMIPFIGTTLGAACVFFMKNEMKPLVQKGLLGFASGVMITASVWSLLIPSMEMSEEMGRFAFVPAAGGFLLGIAFLLLMDRLVPHLHLDSDSPEGVKSGLKKSTMLVFAAGAMMYVVVEELIPETAEGEHSNIATIGFAVGFTLMMVLDVALG